LQKKINNALRVIIFNWIKKEIEKKLKLDVGLAILFFSVFFFFIGLLSVLLDSLLLDYCCCFPETSFSSIWFVVVEVMDSEWKEWKFGHKGQVSDE